MVTGRSDRDPILANLYPLREWVEDMRPRIVATRTASEPERVAEILSRIEIRALPIAGCYWLLTADGQRYSYGGRIPDVTLWIGGFSEIACKRRILAEVGDMLGVGRTRLPLVARRHKLYRTGRGIGHVPHPDSKRTQREINAWPCATSGCGHRASQPTPYCSRCLQGLDI